jgi:phosphoserine phosphatase
MAKILLIRHGHVEGIQPERFRGREPLALTARGRAEAEAVAGRLAASWEPKRIYTSPMDRCIETANAIARACAVAAPVTLDDLNDIDYGAWQFKAFLDAKAENPGLFAAWFATPQLIRFPGGESLQDLAARSGNVIRLVLSRHPEDTVVLVSHDSFNRVLLLELLGLSLSAYWRIAQNPCCVNEIDVVDGNVCIRRLNETHHLDAIESVN